MEDKSSSERSESCGLQHAASRPATGEEDVNFFVLNELMRKLIDNVSTSGISKVREQKITILKHEIKEQQNRLKQYQLILASVEDVIKENKISATISGKVANIIATEKEAQFFQNCPMDTYPLGLKSASGSKESELKFDEITQLQKAVEESIVEKCNAIQSSEDNEPAMPSPDKSNLLKLNAKLDEAVLQYNESLSEACTLLRQISSYEVPISKINRSQAESLFEELQTTELKANLLECKITNNMYCEDENVERAIDKIDTAVKLEMESVSQELKELKALKAKYDHLRANEQYEKILKEYREVQKAIEDKKWLLVQFNSK